MLGILEYRWHGLNIEGISGIFGQYNILPPSSIKPIYCWCCCCNEFLLTQSLIWYHQTALYVGIIILSSYLLEIQGVLAFLNKVEVGQGTESLREVGEKREGAERK